MDCLTSPTRKQFCFSRVRLSKIASWTPLESWYSSTSTSRNRRPTSTATAVGADRSLPSSRSRVRCSKSLKSRICLCFFSFSYSAENCRTSFTRPRWAWAQRSKSPAISAEVLPKTLARLPSSVLKPSRTGLMSAFASSSTFFFGKSSRPKLIRMRAAT